ncbi:MAG TPA: hypothetical protein VFT64_00580 [Rickettsiales bacterium]|nr:hypothetical protein [Rickettsiales bacterium]
MPLLLIIILFLFPFYSADASNPIVFNRPQTAAEKALDHILKTADSMGGKGYDFYAYVTGSPTQTPSRSFASFVTDAYRNTVTSMQNAALKTNCNGKYLEGEECGLNINPILCAQDSPPTYFYHTAVTERNSAVVLVAWSAHAPLSTTVIYHMRYESPYWKVDGVNCDNYWHGMKFNM